MSGSDNYNKYDFGGGSSDDCDFLNVEVRLSSVQIQALETLKLGDKLLISHEDGSVVVKTLKGLVVGSIASAEVVVIIKCISSGKKFSGIIIELREGLCGIKLNIQN